MRAYKTIKSCLEGTLTRGHQEDTHGGLHTLRCGESQQKYVSMQSSIGHGQRSKIIGFVTHVVTRKTMMMESITPELL